MTGHQLANRRKECGWSQYRLAELLGVRRARIAAYEQGLARVPARIASEIQTAADLLVPARQVVENALSKRFADEPLKARHTRWD